MSQCDRSLSVAAVSSRAERSQCANPQRAAAAVHCLCPVLPSPSLFRSPRQQSLSRRLLTLPFQGPSYLSPACCTYALGLAHIAYCVLNCAQAVTASACWAGWRVRPSRGHPNTKGMRSGGRFDYKRDDLRLGLAFWGREELSHIRVRTVVIEDQSNVNIHD